MVDYARWERDLADEKGNIRQEVVYVEVRKESDGLLATIYSGRTGGALANPFSVTDGIAGFHAAASPGGYQIRLYIGASLSPAWERSLRYVPLGLLAESDGTFPGVAYFTDGSAAAPAIAFASDADTGLYRVGADIIGVATGGSERLRIDASGRIGIGGATAVGSNVRLISTITGAVNSQAFRVEATVQSDVTTIGRGYLTVLSSQATAFTLGQLNHFEAAQGTIGAGSTVSLQKGFYAGSTLTGAATNYGFFSELAASGSARWNFYASGTAPNYMAGALGIGTTSVTAAGSPAISVGKSATGATTVNNILADFTVMSDVTSTARGFVTNLRTQAAAFALITLTHFGAFLGSIGAGSTVTNQYGFSAASNLVGATNNYGFYGDIAAASGRWNFYANGDARNYMAGGLSLGSSVVGTDPGAGGIVGSSNATFAAFIPSGATIPTNGMFLLAANQVALAANSTTVMTILSNGAGVGSGGYTDSLFWINKGFTSQTTVYGFRFVVTIPSTATADVVMFQSIPSTAAAAFTVGDIIHYTAQINTVGAGSTITQTRGFWAQASLGQAGTAYGFQGSIASGSNQWNIYMSGTARNYMAGALSIGATTDPGTGGLYVNGPANMADTTASTSTATGALKVGGGLGVAGAGYFGGALLSVSATGGIGYATGAGGTVTQATSKSTAVTLNKTTGAITTHSAALAAATIVSFVLNNSAIAATDLIVAMHESGGTLGSYTINARATGAGTAAIDIRNNTAGSLSEALEIRFAVIKSVDS